MTIILTIQVYSLHNSNYEVNQLFYPIVSPTSCLTSKVTSSSFAVHTQTMDIILKHSPQANLITYQVGLHLNIDLETMKPNIIRQSTLEYSLSGKHIKNPSTYHINLLRNTLNSAYIKTSTKTEVVQATCPNPPSTSRHNHLKATTTSPARIFNASPLRVEALSLNRWGCCRS